MKLLAEISDESLGIGEGLKLNSEYRVRKSARVILLNEQRLVATQYLNTYTYHKLPGGGLDPGETLEQAAAREVLEEVGCDCEINSLVGVVIEYRDKHKLLHISYCFIGKVAGKIGEPSLEEGEIEEGQETLWLPATVLLDKMKNEDKPQKYAGYFISKREQTFLTEYLEKII